MPGTPCIACLQEGKKSVTAAFGVILVNRPGTVLWVCVRHALAGIKLDIESGGSAISAITHIKSNTVKSDQSEQSCEFLLVDDYKGLLGKFIHDVTTHHLVDDETKKEILGLSRTVLGDVGFLPLVTSIHDDDELLEIIRKNRHAIPATSNYTDRQLLEMMRTAEDDAGVKPVD